MIDYDKILELYYTPGNDDYRVLLTHSRQVAEAARMVCARLQSRHQNVDTDFVWEAAMLHDIGVFLTDAPGIFCYGEHPYIQHGVLGSRLLRELGLPRHALVCERHTGAGITAQEIVEQHLPIEPVRDLLPVTLEEKVVCYADKFYSKSHPGDMAKPVEKVRMQLMKFGADTVRRFDEMAVLFGPIG